jgi:hypothetical protein
MTVLPFTSASRNHNCCIDGGTSPEYFGDTLVLYNAASRVVVNEELVLCRHLSRGTEENQNNSGYDRCRPTWIRTSQLSCALSLHQHAPSNHKVQHRALNSNKNVRFSPGCKLLLCELASLRVLPFLIIIIINIKGWAIWPVPSPELQLFSPAFLRSPNRPVPYIYIYLVQYTFSLQFVAYGVVFAMVIKGVACQRSQ